MSDSFKSAVLLFEARECGSESNGHAGDGMMVLVLPLACAPPQAPERSWRGERVAAHRESHLRLDEWPSVMCSPAGDEDLIMRLKQGWMTLFVSRSSGPRQTLLMESGMRGVSTINSYAASHFATAAQVQGAYEVAGELTCWEVMNDVFPDMQNERQDDVGLKWTTSLHVDDEVVVHNLSGSIESAGGHNEYIGRPGRPSPSLPGARSAAPSPPRRPPPSASTSSPAPAGS